jgi:predicted hydrocarbon binding protein
MTTNEALEGGRLKGSIIRAHLDWASKNLGAGAQEKIAEKVSPETAQALGSSILATQWYPFRLLIEVDRAIIELAGGDPDGILLKMGRHSADLNLSTVRKVFPHRDPHEFFRKEAVLHNQFLSFGNAEYTKVDANTCHLVLKGYPCYSRIFCQSALGYYERAGELQGGTTVRVIETQCICRGDPGCVFEISWE